MTLRLVTADDLCAALETTLRDGLPTLIGQLGLDVVAVELASTHAPYVAPEVWDQVPDLDALSSANFPAGGITSPGLTNPPRRHGATWEPKWDGTWRVAAGIYDRGRDYAETQRRCRQWAALIRAAVLLDPSLGGVASSLMWVGEEYRRIPQRNAARTLAGCAVAFDVSADNVFDLSALDPQIGSTSISVTVRPPQE